MTCVWLRIDTADHCKGSLGARRSFVIRRFVTGLRSRPLIEFGVHIKESVCRLQSRNGWLLRVAVNVTTLGTWLEILVLCILVMTGQQVRWVPNSLQSQKLAVFFTSRITNNPIGLTGKRIKQITMS